MERSGDLAEELYRRLSELVSGLHPAVSWPGTPRRRNRSAAGNTAVNEAMIRYSLGLGLPPSSVEQSRLARVHESYNGQLLW